MKLVSMQFIVLLPDDLRLDDYIIEDVLNDDLCSLIEFMDENPEFEIQIIPISSLLKLWELVGDLNPEDAKNPTRMDEFMDAAGNLDIWG